MYPRRTKKRLPAALLICLVIAAAGLTLCLTPNGRTTTAAAASSASSSATLSRAQSATSPSVNARRRLNGKIAYVSGDANSIQNHDIWVMNPDGSNPTNLTPNTAQSAEVSPAWSPDGAKLVFSRSNSVTGESELFVMNADGSSQTKLPVVGAVSPVWSPDGTKFVYSSRRNNVSDIYIANADGSGEVKLTDNAGSNSRPAWSPDGSQIAFDSTSRPSGDGIYLMNADGSNQRRIVDTSVVKGAHSPKWSPDGSLIMFSGALFANPGPAKAYLVAPDGSNLTSVNGSGPYYDPAWSPDGQRIVFRTHDELAADIGVVNLDGTGFNKFSPNTRIIDSQPAWQPLIGGEGKILFTSERDGNPEIYVMDANGSNQINLTNNPAKDSTPAWSPDRTRIAFTSDRSGRSNIYVMDADGGQVRAVTHIGFDTVDFRVYDPAWSPDGTKLVYVGSFMGETSGLYVVNADGTGESRRLPEGSSDVADPAWSPDGSRIAYVGREGFNNPEDGISYHLFVVNADGTGKTRVGRSPLPFSSFPYPPTGSGPAWSPDGARLAYSISFGSTIPQIQHVSASGGHPTSITNHPSANTQPGWTADNQIVFTSDRDGQRDIYSIPVEGNVDRPTTRLTQTTAADYDPNPQHDPVVPQRTASTIQWRDAFFRVREGGTGGGDPLVVTRLGDLSRAASVDYETSDPPPCVGDVICSRHASERSDYIRTSGTLHFAPGEAAKTINVPLVDDIFVEGDQFYDLVLTGVTGATLGAQATSRVTITDNDTAQSPDAPNPIDGARFFVRMHYLDFLGREPEAAGWDAWVGVWNTCPDINRDERCDRITISSAFFRSQEFQMRGFFIYRFYRASFNRRPTYAEFVRDTARITGQTLAEIDASKDAFAQAWMQRADFRAAYFSTGGADSDYVSRLIANTGATLTGNVTRATLEADLRENRRTHAGVLRAIVDHPNVEAALYNEAFVTMQYFGYLKRDPEEEGFQNWMRVINRGDGYRVMVHGFVNSVEYRARFGRP